MTQNEIEEKRIAKAKKKIATAKARIKANEAKEKSKRQKEVEKELKRTGINYHLAYDRFIHWLKQQPSRSVQ